MGLERDHVLQRFECLLDCVGDREMRGLSMLNRSAVASGNIPPTGHECRTSRLGFDT
jgi:hypothetical protein